MRGFRKLAVMQAASLLMTGGTAFMSAATEAAWSVSAFDYDGPEDNGEFYFYRRNGYIEIREYIGDNTQAVIPKELDGLPVLKVGTEDYPFLSGGAQNRVTSIVIPDTVQAIGNCAFKDCTELTYINVPESVKHIGNSAFEGCTKLKTVRLPKELDRIWPYCFKDCKALTSIRMPESIQMIELDAFRNCTSLESVTIPAGTMLSQYAFKD